MEWIILFAMVSMYCDLSSKIKKLGSNQDKNKSKDYSILKKMIGKRIKVELDEGTSIEFGLNTEGILKDFNSRWLALEVESKKKRALLYLRLNNIASISEVLES